MSLPEQLQQSDRLEPLVWKITSVAVIGSFLSQLDATVVNVSLSTLAVELHSSHSAIQWITSGYLLVLALMLPLNGRPMSMPLLNRCRAELKLLTEEMKAYATIEANTHNLTNHVVPKWGQRI
jgi:hypothetical protein